MMRIFRKNISVPQSTMREEPVENRQDMEIISNSSIDFTQPAHQNPSPNGKRRPFFGRVGGLLRRLLRRGKKKKVFSDPEEINAISSAITEDNVTVSEKKTETARGTDSALHHKLEELEFTPSAEVVAAPIDGLQLSILTETVALPESANEISTTTDIELDQTTQTQSTKAEDIVETVSNPADGIGPKTITESNSSSDTTYISTGELEFITTSSSNGSDSEDTTQSTDSSDIVETESTLTDEYVVRLTDWMNICIGTEAVSVRGRLNFKWKINVEFETGPERTCASEEVTNSTTSEESDQPAQQTSTPVGNGQSFLSKVRAYFSKKEKREENEVREGENEEKEEREGDKEEREREREEREGEKVETSSKEVSKIQFDVHTPLTPESFTYHELLGKGEFGKVLVASHPSVDQLLAIKIAKIPPWPSEMIFVERQVMEAMGDCRFFPQLFATFHTEHFLCYVMEYVNGETLRQFMDNRKHLDIDTIRFIAAELLCGLQFLQSRGIAHNDLHSENILIDSTGHVKIIDFGMACRCIQYSMSSEVVQRIPRHYFPDYLALNSFLMDMRNKSNRDAQLQDLIWKISTFPDPESSVTNLRNHPFFTGMNWDELEAGRISSPCVMEPSPAINRSLKIDVELLLDTYKCDLFLYRKFSEIRNDSGFDFVSDGWRDMQQHH